MGKPSILKNLENSESKFSSKVLEVDCDAVTIKSEPLHIHLKLDYHFPYQEPREIQWSYMKTLLQDLEKWLLLSFSQEKEHQNLASLIKSAYPPVIGGVSLSPRSWSDLSLDPRGREKHLVTGKYWMAHFLFDDILDGAAGCQGYNIFVTECTQIVCHALLFKYKTLDQLQADVKKLIEALPPSTGEKVRLAHLSEILSLFFDLARDLQEGFGILPSGTIHIVRETKWTFMYNAWLGKDQIKHVDDMKLRNKARIKTVGAQLLFEFSCMMEGLQIPEELREDLHFIHLMDIYSESAGIINDIFSFPKECEERAGGVKVDNILIAFHENKGLTFAEAAKKVEEKHNYALRLFQQLFEYLEKTSKERVGIAETGEELDKARITLEILKILREQAAGTVEMHQWMKERYTDVKFVIKDNN